MPITSPPQTHIAPFGFGTLQDDISLCLFSEFFSGEELCEWCTLITTIIVHGLPLKAFHSIIYHVASFLSDSYSLLAFVFPSRFRTCNLQWWY